MKQFFCLNYSIIWKGGAEHATSLAESTPDTLEETLLSDQVELIRGYYPNIEKSAIYQQRLFSNDLAPMVCSRHNIKGPRMTLEKFADAKYVFVKEAGARG